MKYLPRDSECTVAKDEFKSINTQKLEYGMSNHVSRMSEGKLEAATHRKKSEPELSLPLG